MDTCDIYPAVREYAFETQSFVASCSAYMSDDIPEEFGEDELGFNVAAGGSMLVNPAGVVKAGPVVGETLLTAEFNRDERRATKAYFDAMGHYTRWDAVNLEVSDHRNEPIHTHDHDSTESGQTNGELSAAEVQAIADDQDISIETVETVADAVQGQ